MSAPSEYSDQPGRPPSRSESTLYAHWVAKDPSFLHANSKDSDQTGRMLRLIWVSDGRTLILLVLSCRGSFERRIHLPISSWRSLTANEYKLISLCFLLVCLELMELAAFSPASIISYWNILFTHKKLLRSRLWLLLLSEKFLKGVELQYLYLINNN